MTKRLHSNRILAGLALAGAAAVTPLLAAKGDIPIYQPTTITVPGNYVVTRDITTQGDIIVVLSGGVTLDLNGHTISSQGGNGVTVDLAGSVHPCLVVANGRIAGGTTGIKVINMPAATTLIVDKVGIAVPSDDCIDFGGARLVVRDSVLRECGGDGIHMAGNGTGLLECKGTHILDVGGNGIYTSSTAGVVISSSTINGFSNDPIPTEHAGVRAVSPGKRGLSILDSAITGGGAQGIGVLLDPGGVIGPLDIVGNTIGGNGASGIDLRQGAARIAGNTITANLGDGIRVDAAGIVVPTDLKDNSILGNTLNGVDIRAGVVRLTGNTVGGNLQNGVSVAGIRALVEGNFLQGNGGIGLKFLNGTGHAYRDNFVRGNTVGDVQDLFGNTDAGGNIK